jgi:CBS domain-containing protein
MMSLNNRLGHRDVISLAPTNSVLEAARAMGEFHVGCAVIVEPRGRAMVPVGIVTDRDIVVRAVALDADLARTSVASIMSKPVVCGHIEDDDRGLRELMQRHGVRRIPLLDETGDLASIRTLDDLIEAPAYRTAR